MRKHFASALEWLLVAVLAVGGFNTAMQDPRVWEGPIQNLIGGEAALFLWGSLFLGSAVSLAYAKIFKEKRVHAHALMFMYLVSFAAMLASLWLGDTWTGVIEEVIITILAAGLWLRWRQKAFFIPIDKDKIRPV